MNELDTPPAADPTGEESVARLLRLAGHRPAVPAVDAAIVKEAARAEWRRTVKVRRRRNLYAGGGLLAAAALLLLVLAPSFWRLVPGFWRLAPGSASAPVATLVATTGNVVVSGQRDGSLVAGAVVQTAAGSARAVLELADDSTIRVDGGTRLELVSASILDLRSGAVYVDSGPANGALEVRTLLGVARDIGTRFEVRLEPDTGSLRVRVRDGEVELTRGDDVYRALAGDEIEVSADGTVQERKVPAGAWEWLRDILPAYPGGIGLSPMPAFLDWLAEEAALELEYADDEAQARCKFKRAGPVAGLSLDEVVAYALPSQLVHRVAEGRLVIEWQRPAGAP